MAKPIFDEAVFREAITRWEVNADRASAERILAGVGVVVRDLDRTRSDLEKAQGAARTYRLNYEAQAWRTTRVRALADDMHELGCPVDGTRPECPGCRVLTVINGPGMYATDDGTETEQ